MSHSIEAFEKVIDSESLLENTEDVPLFDLNEEDAPLIDLNEEEDVPLIDLNDEVTCGESGNHSRLVGPPSFLSDLLLNPQKTTGEDTSALKDPSIVISSDEEEILISSDEEEETIQGSSSSIPISSDEEEMDEFNDVSSRFPRRNTCSSRTRQYHEKRPYHVEKTSKKKRAAAIKATCAGFKESFKYDGSSDDESYLQDSSSSSEEDEVSGSSSKNVATQKTTAKKKNTTSKKLAVVDTGKEDYFPSSTILLEDKYGEPGLPSNSPIIISDMVPLICAVSRSRYDTTYNFRDDQIPSLYEEMKWLEENKRQSNISNGTEMNKQFGVQRTESQITKMKRKFKEYGNWKTNFSTEQMRTFLEKFSLCSLNFACQAFGTQTIVRSAQFHDLKREMNKRFELVEKTHTITEEDISSFMETYFSFFGSFPRLYSRRSELDIIMIKGFFSFVKMNNLSKNLKSPNHKDIAEWFKSFFNMNQLCYGCGDYSENLSSNHRCVQCFSPRHRLYIQYNGGHFIFSSEFNQKMESVEHDEQRGLQKPGLHHSHNPQYHFRKVAVVEQEDNFLLFPNLPTKDDVYGLEVIFRDDTNHHQKVLDVLDKAMDYIIGGGIYTSSECPIKGITFGKNTIGWQLFKPVNNSSILEQKKKLHRRLRDPITNEVLSSNDMAIDHVEIDRVCKVRSICHWKTNILIGRVERIYINTGSRINCLEYLCKAIERIIWDRDEFFKNPMPAVRFSDRKLREGQKVKPSEMMEQ